MSDPTDPPDWQKRNQGKSASAFERARELKDKQVSKEAEPGKGSEQVKQSEPTLKPNPPSFIRNGPDRQAHLERMAKDDKAAKLDRAQDKKDAILERRAQEKEPEKARDEKER